MDAVEEVVEAGAGVEVQEQIPLPVSGGIVEIAVALAILYGMLGKLVKGQKDDGNSINININKEGD